MSDIENKIVMSLEDATDKLGCREPVDSASPWYYYINDCCEDCGHQLLAIWSIRLGVWCPKCKVKREG